MKPNLDILNQIKQVDAPPFLFTRIQQQIDNGSRYFFSKRLAWSLGVSFAIVVIMNVALLSYNAKINRTNTNLAEVMDLMPNNSLY
jgi:hypothetical protein